MEKIMDKIIENLSSTTFSGRRFTRKQIEAIQTIVKQFPKLSRRELGETVCECFNWVTPNGTNKIQTCLGTLEKMEELGIFTLPPKIESKKRQGDKKILWTEKTNEQSSISCSLDELLPLTLQIVTEKEEVECWKGFVDRYHYLGYKRPIGAYLRYYIIDRQGRRLGCLLFSYASCSLPVRDQWIGWTTKERKQNLQLVINNNRFLIFPWVDVKCLASKVLSMVVKQVGNDWEDIYAYRPVLLETFVDPTKYKGTCYQAANWELIGETNGQKATKNSAGKPSKEIYMMPLVKNFREQLATTKKLAFTTKPKLLRTKNSPENQPLDNAFTQLWVKIISLVSKVANDFDQQWQKRKRILNTLLIMLFILRLVFSKNKQGYTITAIELWEQCRRSNIPLPQVKPVAASAFCNAREKLDENIFKTLNTEILNAYGKDDPNYKWKNHRLFAVDGTRITLPKQLESKGYHTQSGAYYPQGLASCLYQLISKTPIDFDLVSHNDERELALTHLQVLQANDVVVYDRGYFSYAMLYAHQSRGIHCVFRLKKRTNSVIDAFRESDDIEREVLIEVSDSHQKTICSRYHEITYAPLTLRLVKYVRNDVTYVIGTTLLDSKCYTADDLADVYFSRWGVEELYKVSKNLIDVEDFHSQTERKVKQELFAHFVIITLSRIFSNKVEDGFRDNAKSESGQFNVNLKNCLLTVARYLESLFLQHEKFIKKTVKKILSSVSNCRQKVRPNRSYERRSKKPINKWQSNKKTKNISTAQAMPA